MLHGLQSLRAYDLDVAHVADVKESDRGANGHVLVDDAAANGRGVLTGMSQPLKSTIFAPIWRWTAFRAVLRMVGVASTEDNRDLNHKQWLACPGCVDMYA